MQANDLHLTPQKKFHAKIIYNFFSAAFDF